MKVLVVGDIMLDMLTVGSIDRMSPEEPSAPVLRIGLTTLMPGGAANVASNLAGLGAECVLIGTIGRDSEAVVLERCLQMAPSIHSLMLGRERGCTTVKQRYVVSRTGKQIFRVDREDVSEPTRGEQEALIVQFATHMGAVSAVVISDYAKGVVTDSVARAVIGLARQDKVPVIVDAKRPDRPCFAGATVLKPNVREIAVATGHREPVSDLECGRCAAELLQATKVPYVLLTRGKDGMILIKDGHPPQLMFIDAYKVDAVDVTGAGDTVAAALAFAIAHGTPMLAAAAFANAAAACVVQDRGTTMPSLKAIGEIYDHPYGRYDWANSAKLESAEFTGRPN